MGHVKMKKNTPSTLISSAGWRFFASLPNRQKKMASEGFGAPMVRLGWGFGFGICLHSEGSDAYAAQSADLVEG